MRMPAVWIGFLLVAIVVCPPTFGQQAAPSPETQFMPQDTDVRKLQQELQVLLKGFQDGKSRDSRTGAHDLDLRARGIAREIQKRVLSRLLQVIQQNLGPMQEIQWDTVPLDATDAKGHIVEVPMSIQVRPLRRLTDLGYTVKTNFVLGADNLALTLYDTLPQSVAPDETGIFERAYVGDDALAVETEAKLLVSLKGGEWTEPATGRPVANAIAVRGLDLDEGLKPNDNKTYDDTLYLVVNAPGQAVEAYEFRMTTESSSAQRGVGRLDSKQVWYVRGLHRGKDPAYCLKGSLAEGTRVGQQGTFQIAGANIHSAYSKRTIDSKTPLSPNVSLGCQVIAARKPEFEKSMVKVLDAKGIREFPYTIVDGEELAVLDSALSQRQKQSILIHGVPRSRAEALKMPNGLP